MTHRGLQQQCQVAVLPPARAEAGAGHSIQPQARLHSAQLFHKRLRHAKLTKGDAPCLHWHGADLRGQGNSTSLWANHAEHADNH